MVLVEGVGLVEIGTILTVLDSVFSPNTLSLRTTSCADDVMAMRGVYHPLGNRKSESCGHHGLDESLQLGAELSLTWHS